mmetsp:Transcript_91338/g.190974  ORF Transcript_91338/g.190974 Transcript_91338/m.190974 type:complete len:299 (-) Transcript_91338:186-1082(-)|eukprot:CAMPEP_0206478158 /NCGR_PEP_ID=MMETSP0324_2-20121206/35865_1 /ASSEMBLY_ACC=CAM_ASM_000836 /TAXON_ID=2866 /ORGANISM="Crypthecodinium cohnii, Strain Seligo" /LENGTH=298 /DNA_ID=CAMNT_0053954367 /DNA_START=196 /DNA_END=1092 /DNA_ORIENTATION=-
MAIDTPAHSLDAASLRESLEGLSNLMAKWHEQTEAVRQTVEELSECAGLGRLSQWPPKHGDDQNGEVINFTSLISDPPDALNDAPCDRGRSDISVEFHGNDDGDSSSSSSGFDFTVDESWAARINQMEADLDEDSQISLVAIRLRRGEPETLCRIDEATEEEHHSSLSRSSSSSSEFEEEESSAASRDPSVERMWAAVPEVGPDLPSTIPEPDVIAAAVVTEPKAARHGRRIVRKRKVRQHGQKGDGDGDRKEARSTSVAPTKQVFEVPASFRLRSTPMGPKDKGPLSEMQTRALDTE